jgi:hypothetical protein
VGECTDDPRCGNLDHLCTGNGMDGKSVDSKERGDVKEQRNHQDRAPHPHQARDKGPGEPEADQDCIGRRLLYDQQDGRARCAVPATR